MMEKIKGSIMDTVENIFAQARQTGAQPVSFEIFPPKGELSMESAHTIAQELAKLDPAFISVTYSAGGSGNKQATAEIAAMICSTLSAIPRANSKKDDIAMRERIRLFCRRVSRCKEGRL